MNFHRHTLDTCRRARGAVVVIDVIRAFTTAAYALAAGAERILLAGEIKEALDLRRRYPGALLMGEVGGLPIPGFDYGNSPAALVGKDFSGKTLIQRTSHGTQGVIRSPKGSVIFAASFATASATAAALRRLDPPDVSFVITGVHDGGWGDEDDALADYLQARLAGASPDPAPYLERVRSSPAGQEFLNPAGPLYNPADLALCLQVDAFDFALPVRREDGLAVMRRGE